MESIESKGRLGRIRNCACELLSMEEDLINNYEEESWQLVERELNLKCTYLYCDLNQCFKNTSDKRKKALLTHLARGFFHCVEELGDALKARSIPQIQNRYKDAVHALQEVMASLAPPLYCID